MTPGPAPVQKNGKTVFNNLQVKRQKQQSKYNIGDLFRTADNKKSFQ